MILCTLWCNILEYAFYAENQCTVILKIGGDGTI